MYQNAKAEELYVTIRVKRSDTVSRPYYSDYIKHAMRFYSRNLYLTKFKSEADKNNWKSCESVLKRYEEKDREILQYAYGEFDTIADNVYIISKKHNIEQDYVWDMMREFERKVAKTRGLL